MAAALTIPPPPDGFELDSPSVGIPPPPDGFELETPASVIPAPPEGFVLDAPDVTPAGHPDRAAEAANPRTVPYASAEEASQHLEILKAGQEALFGPTSIVGANLAALNAQRQKEAQQPETFTTDQDGREVKSFEELGPFETIGGVGKAQYERSKKAGFKTGTFLENVMTPAFEPLHAPTAKELREKYPDLPEGSERPVAIMEGVVSDFGNFFTSPLGVASLGLGAAPKAVHKLVAGAFAAHAAKNAPEAYAAIVDAKTPEEKDLAIRAAIGQAIVLAGGTFGALRREPIGAAERAESMDTARLAIEQQRIQNEPTSAPVGNTRPAATPEAAQPPTATVVPESLPEGAKLPAAGQPLAEPAGAVARTPVGEAPPVDFKAEAERIRTEWMQERAEETKPAPVAPEVEQRLRTAHQELVKESPWGFPDVPLSDLLERAGFKPDAEGLAAGKSAIKQMQVEGKMDLGGGDWSLATDRQRASGVIGKPGDPPAIYGKFREGEAAAPKLPPVAEEWRQQAIPEELRTSRELEEALAGTPETPKGSAPFAQKDFSQGGALGGRGGGKSVVNPVGATPKGDPNFIRVESAPKRLFKGLLTEGAADVMAKSKNKVGQLLAKQMRKHVDVEQELTGQLTAELDRGTKGMSSKQVEAAIAELEPYLAAKENRRPLPTLSKGAQSLLTAWENIAERTGLLSEAHNVQVFDPTTGSYRPMHRIGRSYVPRVFKPEVQQVLSDPKTNPKLFNDLAAALAAHRGITPEAAAAELRGVAGRFQSSDFMGNIEMARTGQLPESFYDYNLGNIISKYVPSFSERMAQIVAYGQRLGPREAPLRQNLWDVAMKEAEDGYTQQWIRSAEDQAVNLQSAGGAAKVARQAQTLASGLLLASPTTTVMRNMLSGTGATAELLGLRRSASKLIEAATNAQAKLDAREIGAVRENLGDFLHADQLGKTKGDDLIRGIVNTTLKWSGYTGSEGFVRTHAAATAAQFVKDGVAAIAKDPTSARAKEALGLFKRMGADAEKIVAENGDWKTGAESRKLIRTVIRDSQGGYRFDQVPLWLNSPTGRFFFQYLRWGAQRSRNIWKNGIQPLIGEEVQWHGKTMARRDAGPIIKMGLAAIVLGEGYALMSQGFFGRDRKDASVQEITQALTEDQKNAAVLMADRLINDILMSGSLGIWSQPVDALKSLKDQSRLRNPAEPPSMSAPKAAAKLAKNALDQEGRVTNRDLIEFVGGVAPGVKQISDFARNIFDEPLYEAENDVRTLRAAASRWAQANKIDVPKRAVTSASKSVNSPEYEAIHEALLVGDGQRAKFLADKFVSEKRGEMANVKQSVKSRQPFRVGPFTNAEYKTQFMTWAASHLPKKDYEQAQRVQDRYKAAANSAGLW